MTFVDTRSASRAADVVVAHVACTRCRYDLYGSVTRRCPECGADIDLLGLFVQSHFLGRAGMRERLVQLWQGVTTFLAGA